MTQTSDIQLIEKSISHYFEGMTSHNAEALERAFHPKAIMKWIEKGEYKEVNAVQALSDYVNANEPAKVKTKIVAINIAGDAANAQLELEYETFAFVDFMHLMNINGEWKIVSKTYTTIPKEF